MEAAAARRTGNAFRPGTLANHRSHVLLYAAFALYFKLPDFPATAKSLVLFGEFLLRAFRAPKSVTNALASIRAFHLDGGLATGAFLTRQLSLFRRSLPITLRHVPARAPPLPFAVLEQLCGAARGRGEEGLVFATLLSVTFFAMVRLSSVVPASRSTYDFSRFPSFADIEAGTDGVRLRIKWGKCQQASGHDYMVPLRPLAASPACPVALLSRLTFSATGIPASTPLFSLPRRVRGTARGTRFFTTGGARRWLASVLRQVGAQGCGYTFHSLRRGACSRAYERGAHLADLQFMGGWKGNSVELYVQAEAARERAARCLTSDISAIR